jgi:3'-5' exoribonuclease 1
LMPEIRQLPLKIDIGKFANFDIERRPKPMFDYFCVMDFECTCDTVNTNPHEIIEFPAVFLNARTLQVDMEFHSFVRPVEHPVLTDFCCQLTGIKQAQVNEAPILEDVLQMFHHFCKDHGLAPAKEAFPEEFTFCVATDGPWDICRFLQPECDRKRLTGRGSAWRKVVNIRKMFRDHNKQQGGGVVDMLARFGLEFDGREHSGLDDSRNIARILACLIANGVNVTPNLDTKDKVV